MDFSFPYKYVGHDIRSIYQNQIIWMKDLISRIYYQINILIQRRSQYAITLQDQNRQILQLFDTQIQQLKNDLRLIDELQKANNINQKPFIITFYKQDQNLFLELKNIMNSIPMDNKELKKIYLFGGFLRDRIIETIHGEKTKVSDYDFIIRKEIYVLFKEELIKEKEKFEIDFKKTDQSKKILFAKFFCKSQYGNKVTALNINIKTIPLKSQIEHENDNRDFYINSLTYDIIDDKIVIDPKQQKKIKNDLLKKEINIINDFEKTFEGKQSRFLRALLLISRGYQLSEDLLQQMRKKINYKKYRIKVVEKHMYGKITRIFYSDHLNKVYEIIVKLQIQRIFFKDKFSKEYIEFMQQYSDSLQFQFDTLSQIKKDYFSQDFEIIKKIIELIQKLVIPINYILYHQKNVISEENIKLNVFTNISYNFLKKMNQFWQIENQRNLKLFCYLLIKDLNEYQQIKNLNQQDIHSCIVFYLLIIFLLYEENNIHKDNLIRQLESQNEIIEFLRKRYTIMKQCWNFLKKFLQFVYLLYNIIIKYKQ